MLRQSRVGFLLLFLALILGTYLGRDGLSQPAPGFSLPESGGGQVDLASYRGRPVLLVFWTSSCPICQHELPLLNRLTPLFWSKGVSVLAIHLGGDQAAREFMDSNDIGLTSLVDLQGKVARAYRVGGVPRLVLISPDGRIKRSSSGWTDESVLREWMDSLSGS